MSFAWPALLLLLLLLPLGVAGYIRLDRRRRRAAAQFAALGFAGSQRPRGDLRRHVPPLFFLLALVVLIIALARPQAVVSVPKIKGTVLLAFDVSASMSAEDLEPTRMDAAKAAARAFVAQQPDTVQIGVVAFSDSGLAVQVPTYDRGAVLGAIERLAPQNGTSLAGGIQAALNAIAVDAAGPALQYSDLTPEPAATPTPVPPGYHAPAVVVLLTDGDNTDRANPLEAAAAAAGRGIRIYTVGLGSPAGADLNLDGFVVHTQLDEVTLQHIAELTGGTYYNAESTEELASIYSSLNSHLVVEPETMEVTAIGAGAGILVLLAGVALSLVWFGRML